MAIEILHADNIEALRGVGPGFHLAYLDPPFFTQRDHAMPDGEVAFSDRWEDFEEYLQSVDRVATGAWAVVAPGGSLVLHVDPVTSHYLKVRLDEEFDRDNFATEIVWRYRRWASPTRNFHWMHDVLLRWVKPGAEPRWNQLYEPLSPKTIAQWGSERRQESKNDAGGRRSRSSLGNAPSLGAPLSDVWEIGIIGAAAHERTGYPTQKPEPLLAQLISATTNPGDSVLDPYMGSGTTLAVAHRLGRNAVGIDASQVAIRVARERLAPLLAQGRLFDDAPCTTTPAAAER